MKKARHPKLWQMPKLVEVLSLLPEDGSPVQAKKIKQEGKKRGISPNTIFKYLGKLENISLVLKKVDVSFRPPRVYYKRVTEEELFGDKKIFSTFGSALEQVEPMVKRVSKKLPPGLFKRIWLELRLAYFVGAITAMEGKASTIEPQSRDEFIETITRVHLYPKLLRLSRVESIEPDDWLKAFNVSIEMYQRSLKMLIGEIEKISPGFSERFAKSLIKAIKEQKPSDKLIITEIEELMETMNLLKPKGRQTHADNP